MTTTLYRTDNMEQAIRDLALMYRRVMVFQHHRVMFPIRLRGNLISDIPMLIGKPWMRESLSTLQTFERDGGVLIYMHRLNVPKVPQCDAMVVVEAEYALSKFQRIVECCSGPVVVFRPPDWSKHDEMITKLYATSEVYHTVLDIVHSMIHRDIGPQMAAAQVLTGWPAELCAMFHAINVAVVTGLSERQIRRVFMLLPLQRKCHRYHPYTPVIPPQDDGYRWIYDLLVEQPDVYRGARMLRGDVIGKRNPAGFDKGLKWLINKGHVRRDPAIYILRTDHTPIDDTSVNAIALARRQDWANMKAAIDAAPEWAL